MPALKCFFASNEILAGLTALGTALDHAQLFGHVEREEIDITRTARCHVHF